MATPEGVLICAFPFITWPRSLSPCNTHACHRIQTIPCVPGLSLQGAATPLKRGHPPRTLQNLFITCCSCASPLRLHDYCARDPGGIPCHDDRCTKALAGNVAGPDVHRRHSCNYYRVATRPRRASCLLVRTTAPPNACPRRLWPSASSSTVRGSTAIAVIVTPPERTCAQRASLSGTQPYMHAACGCAAIHSAPWLSDRTFRA